MKTKVKRFISDMLLFFIDSMSELAGMWLFRRLAFRLTWGVWCKHYSWTPWERVDDYRFVKQCEGCMIKRMK